jgi:CubicO group peptidase (beta-lactamase class C family)
MTSLPESTPSRHGVDADGIGAFLDAVDDIELHSLMILRHGEVIASGWWAPYGPDRPHLLYSLSKSFTSTAAGIAFGEGLLDPDATVLSYFPELDADVTDPRSRSMLVRHIASMSSGHLDDTWPAAPRADPDRPVRGFLRIPPDQDPGTIFTYNQSCTYTLATIVQRVTGQRLVDYLRPRLFDVLGIGEALWAELPPGQAIGFTGLHVTTDAIARLGELYLQEGKWEGRQVVPAAWVAEATRKQVATRPDGAPDWQQGYGFQFWMSRHGYRGDGAYGQYCVVLPEQDAVIAITAGTENMPGILDAAWDHLLPAFGLATGTAGKDSDAADAALAKRLDGLRLRPVNVAKQDWPETSVAGDTSGTVVLTPADGAAEVIPLVREVRIAGRTITLAEDELSIDLDLAPDLAEDGWYVTETPLPVAASGGWTGPDTLGVDVVFLETPHRLSLTCALADGTFSAEWVTRPLREAGSLGTMRAPRT